MPIPRREILGLLRRRENDCGERAERLATAKPSHRFAVLKNADLMTSRRQGQQTCYGLNTAVLLDALARAMEHMDADKKTGKYIPCWLARNTS